MKKKLKSPLAPSGVQPIKKSKAKVLKVQSKSTSQIIDIIRCRIIENYLIY